MISTYVHDILSRDSFSYRVRSIQEDLTPETTRTVLEAFRKGEKPKPGPQSGRHTSENSAGLTALTSKVCRLGKRLGSLDTDMTSIAIWPGGVLHTGVQLDSKHSVTSMFSAMISTVPR